MKPTVGMGVTLCYMNDMSPGTVRWVSPSGHRVEVTGDSVMPRPGAIRSDEGTHWDHENAMFSVNERATRRVFTRRKDGLYIEKGSTSPMLHLGTREAYRNNSI